MADNEDMIGSVGVDAPAKGEDFFQRIRETYTNAKKAVQEFIASEEESIKRKEQQVEALYKEIEGHKGNISDAQDHLK